MSYKITIMLLLIVCYAKSGFIKFYVFLINSIVFQLHTNKNALIIYYRLIVNQFIDLCSLRKSAFKRNCKYSLSINENSSCICNSFMLDHVFIR